jgi:hypothetical protein
MFLAHKKMKYVSSTGRVIYVGPGWCLCEDIFKVKLEDASFHNFIGQIAFADLCLQIEKEYKLITP